MKTQFLISLIICLLVYSHPAMAVDQETSTPRITITSFHSADMRMVSQFDQTIITGKVTSELGLSILKINGVEVDVDKKGLFSTTIHLIEGKNKISVEANDKEGNNAEKSIVIDYKKLPPATETNLAKVIDEQKAAIITPSVVQTQLSREMVESKATYWQVWALSIAGVSAALAGASALEYNKKISDGDQEEADQAKRTYQLLDKITIVALIWEGYLLFSEKKESGSVRFYPAIHPTTNESGLSLAATWKWMF